MTEAKLHTARRLINVSNRLPLKLEKKNDAWTFRSSEGGLATGLSSLMGSYRSFWIGWPGAVVSDEQKPEIARYLFQKDFCPVFLTQEEIDGFYEGFSNETLWPLFHYFPSYSVYNEDYWDAYVQVNRKFADAIIESAEPDDLVWIHDYQLMLVPEMVRESIPGIRIGYFHHIPFPDYGIFRALPWKAELMNGMLGADMLGFQTQEDVLHFNLTVEKVLGIPTVREGIQTGGRVVVVQPFPIGIDYAKFHALAEHEQTEFNAQKIRSTVNTKIALSVDRLDYSKGILQRLKAYDCFLERYPEWRQKLTMIHIVVPSRDTVSNYRELKVEMDRLVTCINGKYATLGWQPILHYYQSFEPHMLSAFYKCADLAIVTPLRDGMNLVSKEYVAGNSNTNGMLLLSEAAGAANQLQDALLLNPNDTKDFAKKIYEGLTISGEEKKKRMDSMRGIIAQTDIFRWANAFITKLLLTARKKGISKQEGISINVPIAS